MRTRHFWSLAAVAVVLGVLTGCQTKPEKQILPGNVNDERVTSDAGSGANWLLNGRTNDRSISVHSKQITDKNVSGWDWHGLSTSTAEWESSRSRSSWMA